MTAPEAVAGKSAVAASPVERRAAFAAALRRHAFLMVLVFWWVATGILYALQRNPWTRGIALAGALACLAQGARLLVRSRNDRSALGAIHGFFAGALAWAAVITLFFEGWIVGPPPDALGAATRGWAGAVNAIIATWHWEALGVATLVALLLSLRGATNRLALWTFLLFWGAHQSAKLNLFFGVVNSGAEIFPPYLEHLVRYFGPAENSALLPVTIVAYVVLALWVILPWRAADEGGRMRRMVIAALAGLAAIEHAFLATRLPIMLWELFLRVGRA
jgi:putative photosynthetic complex assembly protein 2